MSKKVIVTTVISILLSLSLGTVYAQYIPNINAQYIVNTGSRVSSWPSEIYKNIYSSEWVAVRFYLDNWCLLDTVKWSLDSNYDGNLTMAIYRTSYDDKFPKADKKIRETELYIPWIGQGRWPVEAHWSDILLEPGYYWVSLEIRDHSANGYKGYLMKSKNYSDYDFVMGNWEIPGYAKNYSNFGGSLYIKGEILSDISEGMFPEDAVRMNSNSPFTYQFDEFAGDFPADRYEVTGKPDWLVFNEGARTFYYVRDITGTAVSGIYNIQVTAYYGSGAVITDTLTIEVH